MLKYEEIIVRKFILYIKERMKNDIKIIDSQLYFIPVEMRTPLKFGTETLDHVICARTSLKVTSVDGKIIEGWGETPINVGWVWPSSVSYEKREKILLDFCQKISIALQSYSKSGHPIEIGYHFIENNLNDLLAETDKNLSSEYAIPHLASLVCFSLFDIAIHDAYGKCHNVTTYKTYNKEYMNYDLSHYLKTDDKTKSFEGKYPEDYLTSFQEVMQVWHLVGGLDPLTEEDKNESSPKDNYPVTLEEWIKKDGLNCLKIKLRGNDSEWDLQRLIKIGEIALKYDVEHLTTDFNCTVQDPVYVNEILDALEKDYKKDT